MSLNCHFEESGIVALLDQTTYQVLVRRAAAVLRRESFSYLLEPADLVHDSLLRIARSAAPVRLRSTAHLLAVVSLVMRRVMVDRNRSAKSVKDGRSVPVNNESLTMHETADVMVVRDAVARLSDCEDRLLKIIEMRFFGGYDVDEIASALSISSRTVKRDWSAARDRLRGLLCA